jgi:hypothetical protein
VKARTLIWWRWKIGTEGRDEQRARARQKPAKLAPDRDEARGVLAKAPVDFVELVRPVLPEPDDALLGFLGGL